MTSDRSRGQAHGVGVIAALLLCACVISAQAAEDCSPVLARVVSVQGTVELRRAGADWKAAELDSKLCAGDMFRVQQRSRAALILSNETTLRLDQGTTLTLAPPDAGGATLLEQLSGGLHVITRTPRRFRVKTPFVNANVEGTEFLVRVNDANTRVAVYEGQVLVSNDVGSVSVLSGEEAEATRNGAPRKALMIRPRDAVVWTLFFPTIFDQKFGASPTETQAELARRRAVALRASGRIAEALEVLEGVGDGSATSGMLNYRAGLLMEVGRIEEAGASLARALQLEPENSDSYALQAVIAVVRDDKEQAFRRASDAVALNPSSAVARTALSFAQQAQFRIDDALASEKASVNLDRENAFAWARLSELELSVGALQKAETAARMAVTLDPSVARTQTVLGFAHLARIATRDARAAFEKAIELDPVDPLPRLGLGLAKIRTGDLVGGRQELEIATSLDPGRSLIRSYLGKGYFEELRNQLAASQFDLAKELDPQDPTPYFYGAIVKQEQNRLVEALDDFTRAIELNDKRVVNRSKLLLDQDLAARQVSRARTYDGLGFGSLALDGAAKAISGDFSDFAAHKFLAEAYESLPRHSIASQSEGLQAELRSPITMPQPDAHFLGDSSYLFRNGSFFQPGQNEFSPLFDSDGVRVYFDATAGGRDTRGQRLFVGGTSGRVSYALSESTYKTDGFESAGAVDKTSYDALVKGQVGVGSTLSVYLKHSTLVVDETFFAFDPTFASTARIDNRQDLVRLGGHHVFAPGTDLVWSATRIVDRQSSRDFPDLVLSSEERATTRTFEAQVVHTLPRVQWVVGAGSTRSGEDFGEGSTIETTASSVYAYARWVLPGERIYLHTGLASEKFRLFNSILNSAIERNRVSPKIGLAWVPNPDFSLRLASYENVRRPLIGGQTLEPTQVNGFNQVFSGIKEFFGDQDGTVSRATSLAFDAVPARHLYSGVSFTRRRLSVPSIVLGQDFSWRDSTGRAYLYHAPNIAWMKPWQTGLSLEYERETFDRPQELTGPEGIIQLRNDNVYARMRLFHPSGVAFGLTVSHIRQTGALSVDAGFPVFDQASRAWLADVNAEYRLPRRLGAIQLGVRNLFDRSFSVIDTDPLRPRFATRRFLFLSVRLAT